MASYRTLFQDHHNIEQQTLKNSELLAKLQEVGRFHIHAPENRLFLPASPQLADALGVTPHSGGPLAEYQKGMLERLNRIQLTRDGQAALEGDTAAMDRVAKRVEQLRDTVKVGLINNDLNTNTPLDELSAQTNQRVRRFFRDIPAYYQAHAQQIEALKGFTGVDHGWGAVAHSESRIVTTLNQIHVSSTAIVRGGDIELQRHGLSLAIANAHHDGRVVFSERSILKVEQILGDETAHNLRVPRGQRGAASMEVLLGNASASTLVRSGGLLATGADAVLTARRSAELLEQGNATAAQSEVTHALARNAGGWAGGASTAAALGGSGFVPAALVVGDALLMSKAFDKGADLLDNRAIYHQTDKAGVGWQFNGRNWQREAAIWLAEDGRRTSGEQPVVASYEKSQELDSLANAKAVELALGKAPSPQDPFNLPAQASDQVGLDNQNWRRNPESQAWERQVKAAVSGANDRGSYEHQTASPERAEQLNQEALGRIEHNIATGREAIAAAYLENHAAQRAQAYGVEVPAAVQAAQAKPGAVLGSDAQLYQRTESGQWAGKDGVASGNLAVELELTDRLRQPSIERSQETLATIQALPAPTASQMEHNELLHRYRAAGVDLNVSPQTQHAVELASQRTMEVNRITGPTMQQLQRNESGQYGYDSPIAHLQRGSDGVTRVVAVTTSEDIRQALSEAQGHRQESATLARAPGATGDADTSTSDSSNPQHVLDIQARMQSSVAAQARQEREQQDRLVQEQHAARVREHLRQAQPEREEKSQSEQAVRAHAVLEGQRQAEQQRELEERQLQERQAQTSQPRELQEREERDAQQRQAHERQAEDNQQREKQDRQAQETRQVEVQERQDQHAQDQQQQTQALEPTKDQRQQASQQPDTQLHAPELAPTQQTTLPQSQQEDARSRLEPQNQPANERLAPGAHDALKQTPEADDAQPRQAQEAEHSLEMSAVENRAAARVQVSSSKGPEPGSLPSQSVQADARPSALTQQVEMEQALARQQYTAREQEAELVRVVAQTTPATAEPLSASQSAASTNPEQETMSEQNRPSDTFLAEHDAPALPPAYLAQAHGQSLGGSAENSFPKEPADAENQQAQSTPEQNRSAADPGGALFLEETMRSLRQLQQEIEAADREDERFHQEWREYRERGEPYPFARDDIRSVDGTSLDEFPQREQAPRSPSEAAEQTDAYPPLAQRFAGPGAGDAPNESSQTQRTSITGDPDIDEVLYALDSKNELAIEQALNRVADSAATHSLIKRGDEFLEAQAQQEAQELAATRQALGMDVSAEVNTSRGPVMVLTLPEFARGPMQSGPQGDGGGGGGGGGDGGGGGGGGGGG